MLESRLVEGDVKGCSIVIIRKLVITYRDYDLKVTQCGILEGFQEQEVQGGFILDSIVKFTLLSIGFLVSEDLWGLREVSKWLKAFQETFGGLR